MVQTQAQNGSSRLPSLKLDPSLYNPSPEELDFLKSQTKIKDEEELKNHVIAVQKEAWELVNYKCILLFGFTRLKLSRLPAYQYLLTLGKERPGAIFLDYACCFGNDLRKAVADGYPQENVIASDLHQEFWDLGHKLYKTTPQTYPVPFIQGSVFDPDHIAPTPPFYSPPTTSRPELSTLTSLTPLQGHVSAIHASAFFHLFTKEDQIKAGRALASLLSPLPGSIIFGMHTSMAESTEMPHPDGGFMVYHFSIEDWKALWDGEIFQKGSVIVEAEFNEKARLDKTRANSKRLPFIWSVKRV